VFSAVVIRIFVSFINLDRVGILLHIFFFFFFLSPFYCFYNAKTFWGLTGTKFIGVIFLGKMVKFSFAESCLPAVYNTKFARGPRKALLLPEPE